MRLDCDSKRRSFGKRDIRFCGVEKPCHSHFSTVTYTPGGEMVFLDSLLFRTSCIESVGKASQGVRDIASLLEFTGGICLLASPVSTVAHRSFVKLEFFYLSITTRLRPSCMRI